MSAQILDGKELARTLREGLGPVIQKVQSKRGRPPCLVIVACGGDPARESFLKTKVAACEKAGIQARVERLPESVSEGEALNRLRRLAADDGADGILIETPLPPRLNFEQLLNSLPPSKDVEGLGAFNYGRLFSFKGFAELEASGHPIPCTPHAVIRLLLKTGVVPAGLRAVVMGRSNILGKPAAHLLTTLDATVTVCHSKTPDAAAHLKGADIVVAAMGRPRLITGEMLKPGAIVLDAGMNEVDGKLCGDVEFESASQVASYITPVPGGVGPVNVALVLSNLVGLAGRDHDKGLP